jgi:hypothetical protein
MWRGFQAQVCASVFLLCGCQTHLPPLETAPGYPGPTVTDITQHLSCEIARVVNAGTTITRGSTNYNDAKLEIEPANGPVVAGMTVLDEKGAIPDGTTILSVNGNNITLTRPRRKRSRSTRNTPRSPGIEYGSARRAPTPHL